MGKALTLLENQLEGIKDDIEIIISDNASIDDTQKIICEFASRHRDMRIKIWRQKKNTGYFGNFKKCRELSHGKYLWIISDDDHLENNILSRVIETLKSNNNVGFIFLNYAKNCINKKIGPMPYDTIFSDQNAYRLTLLSATIYLNNKNDDKFIFSHFNENLFLGYFFLLNTKKYSNQGIILEGKTLQTSMGNVSFDIYKAWNEDMSECISYMQDLGYSPHTISSFVNSFLTNVLIKHYIASKTSGKYLSNTDLDAIESRLKYHYQGYKYFNNFAILFIVPKLFIKIYILIQKFWRRSIKEISKLNFNN